MYLLGKAVHAIKTNQSVQRSFFFLSQLYTHKTLQTIKHKLFAFKLICLDKPRVKLCFYRVFAQDAAAQAINRSYLRPLQRQQLPAPKVAVCPLRQLIHAFTQPAFHFACSLAGKGNRKNITGIYPVGILLQNMRKTLHQHTGLTAARAGGYSYVSVYRFYGL